MENTPNAFLEDFEVEQICQGLQRATRGNFTSAEYDRVMTWAANAKLGSVLLGLILAGRLDPAIGEDGDVAFVPRLSVDASQSPTAAAAAGGCPERRLVPEGAE